MDNVPYDLVYDGEGPEDAQDEPKKPDSKFSLGEPACDVYQRLQVNREQVLQRGREMAELTIPYVLPHRGYITGEELPGNNQSTGAYCVNNLASKLMFQAFPPGQPCFSVEAIEYEVQKQVDQDPQLWANLQLAFAGLERAHRKRFATTVMETTYVQCLKLALVCGNWLWKWTDLDNPVFYTPNDYVVRRDRSGRPTVAILEETVFVKDLPEDVREMVYRHSPEIEKEIDWKQQCEVYSVLKLRVAADGTTRTWLYWQEYKGELIPDTDVETHIDEPPMFAEWMIPVYGQDWGISYCEEYKGDLFAVEAWASSITDAGSMASLALMFVKPGSMSSAQQIREAKNLSVLPGVEGDISMFKSDKSADLNFLVQMGESTARRLSKAFLLQSSIQRDGERVTAEEIQRMGSELDQAMGGVYTQLSQGFQRRFVMRGIKLNEEENPSLPALPKGIVTIQVVTGKGAMGRSEEVDSLVQLGSIGNQIFGPQSMANVLEAPGFMARVAAGLAIKPDGILLTSDQVKQNRANDQRTAMQADVVSKAAGPLAQHLGGALAAHAAPAQGPPQQAGPNANPGAPPPSAPAAAQGAPP